MTAVSSPIDAGLPLGEFPRATPALVDEAVNAARRAAAAWAARGLGNWYVPQFMREQSHTIAAW